LQISDNQITSSLSGSVAVSIDEAEAAPRGVTITNNHVRLTHSTGRAFLLGASQHPVLIGNAVTGNVPGIYSSTSAAVGLTFVANTLTNSSGVKVYHNV
ncbi:NosD domain-containing protein, partial [Neisseria gonorrhoeae]|uniref:NosD domain-containing protein n=1 Tax=Neisseria gonorrhoeae TaxID=485 RepID=UPI00311FAED7